MGKKKTAKRNTKIKRITKEKDSVTKQSVVISSDQYAKRRVVITGIGVISPNGIGKKQFWENTKNGVSGINKISFFDVKGLPIQVAGEVHDLETHKHIDRKELRFLDRFSQFSLIGVDFAVKDSGLPYEVISNNPRIGVYHGTSIAGIPECEIQSYKYYSKGLRAVHPLIATRLFPGAGASHIAIKYNLHKDIYTLSTGCTSSTDAIGLAFREIKRGNIDIAIAGGSENPLSALTVNCFHPLNIASEKYNNDPKKACRPFEKNRDGIVISEGAAFFMLEDLDSAISRSANIYCELSGYGVAHDAFHIAKPSENIIHSSNAMKFAIDEAKIEPNDIDVVFAHGNSTINGDIHETASIKHLFQNHSQNILVPALESMVGHAFGAVGAMKLAAAALSINNDYIFPTINYETPDSECDLNYVPNKGINKKFMHALINSASFGGKYAALVINKY